MLAEVYSEERVRRCASDAFLKRHKRKGKLGNEARSFFQSYDLNCRILRQQLIDRSFSFSYRGVAVPKANKVDLRPIIVCPFSAYVAQLAINDFLLMELPDNLGLAGNVVFGIRLPAQEGKVSAVRQMIRAVGFERQSGFTHGFKTDICQFYPSVSIKLLCDRLEILTGKSGFEDLLAPHCTASIRIGRKDWANLFSAPTGLPQGTAISPLLANVFLNGMDKELSGSFRYARYMDDIVVMCRSCEERVEAWALLQQQLAKLGLACDGPGAKKYAQLEPGRKLEILGCVLKSNGRIFPSEKAISRVTERIGEFCDPTHDDYCPCVRSLLVRTDNFLDGWAACYAFTNIPAAQLVRMDAMVMGQVLGGLRDLGLSIRSSRHSNPTRKMLGLESLGNRIARYQEDADCSEAVQSEADSVLDSVADFHGDPF